MEQIINYVKPEFVAVIVVLHFIGNSLERAGLVKKKYLPLILGMIGIFVCGAGIIGTSDPSNIQEISMAVFTAVVQGTLVAGLSTSINQIMKQVSKN